MCHTDISGDNLLVNDHERLSVLDWDGAIVAPPAHDLHEARWVGFERVLEDYLEAGGARPLYHGHFAFYTLRRFPQHAELVEGCHATALIVEITGAGA